MAAFLVTDEEMDALHELPWVAQLAYLRALRPHMDYETGLIGVRRKISRRQIAEEITVPSCRGRHSDDKEAPTEKAIRCALESLCDAGVIERKGDNGALVFFAKIAFEQQSVRRMRGRSGADEGPGLSGRQIGSSVNNLVDMKGRSGADAAPAMRGLHQVSNISEKESTAIAVLATAAADAPDGAATGVGSADSKIVPMPKRTDNCPYADIVAAYHEALPELPTVRVLTDARKALIRSRWKEHPDMDYWRKFFAYVAKSRFLTGNVPPSGDRPPFVAYLEWLVRPTNFTKVIEGNYHHDEARR